MGRTGKLFAIDHFNITADMICLAKGIASGLPMGAVLISEKISESLFYGSHTNTFGGNPLVCSAAIETLNIINDKRLLDNAAEVGSYFIDELKKIDSSLIREVRGLGLMIAIELKTKCTKYVKEMQDNGLLTIPTGANVIRILPPLIFSKENSDDAVKIIRNALLN
jgi:acetylornithine/LysW-gamma-L-lysine aminotransferase